MRVFSYGGGVQSTAVLVMAARGEIEYDAFLFANVGDDSENPATLEYMRDVVAPYVDKHGIVLEEVRRTYQDGTPYRTIYQHVTETSSIRIPVYMEGGAPGRRGCTNDWKRDTIAKWLKQRGATKDDPATIGLGISIDEYQRMRTDSGIAWEVLEYPLIDRRMTRLDCMNIIVSEGLPVPPKSSCWFCLAGETEVVTRDGIRPIRDLVDTSPELLIPHAGTRGGLSEIGSFHSAPITSFGQQKIWAIRIRRTRTTKVVYATAEHRWLLAPSSQWQPPEVYQRTTDTLQTGDRLRSLRATPIVKENPMPFAIAQGFVFGDGTHGEGDRPASVDIHAGKNEALLPFFALCDPKLATTHYGKSIWRVYGLPRTWKDLPDLRESRSFLLSWLAGYFAADGTLSPNGQAVLYSGTHEFLDFSRSVAAILGIQTTPIRSRMRAGYGVGTSKEPSALHSLNLNVRNLPAWFFLLDHHRDRFDALGVRQHDNHWIVESVEPTDRVEDVYCATVEGVGAFGLADGLMTGNCPYHRIAEWKNMQENQPELYEKSIRLEKLINEKRKKAGKDNVYLRSNRIPLDETEQSPQLGLFEEETCESGYCMV